MMGHRASPKYGWVGLGLAIALAIATPAFADDEPEAPSGEILDGFESPATIWRQEQTDATIQLVAHDRSDRAAREGKTSERFQFGAGLGSVFYYSYPLPNVPVTESLKASLSVRGTRSGVQLFARVVLPADTDPETKRPSFLLIPGTIYNEVDRWQRLEIADLPSAVERQARVLRVSSKRPVPLDGAYVEQLVVNLFAGTGESEVFLDDLKVAPVPVDLATAHTRFLADRLRDPNEPGVTVEAMPESPADPGGTETGAPPAEVARIDRNRLKRRIEGGLYQDWVFTAIHAPGADVGSLRKAGFDVLIDDLDADPGRWREAVARGFLLMPSLRREADGGLPSAGAFGTAAAAFPHLESVAAWHLGNGLGLAADPEARRDERERVRALISAARGLPPGTSPLTTGTVADDLPRYASFPRNLDLLGVRPNAWGSSWEPMDTYQYLKQRRDLTARTNPGAVVWAMLPAAPTPASGEAGWGNDVPPP
ncbi:MAG: hypothetical protein AB7I30_14680, partial [Isosphaeraceae bacterium]